MKKEDIDIKNQFRQKNIQLLTNKLQLDIEGNSNNLMLTTENCVILSFRKFDESIIKELDKNSINYSRFRLDEFNNEQRIKLYAMINNEIQDKYNSIKQYLKDNKIEQKKEKSYIINYCKYIDKIQNDFSIKVNAVLDVFEKEYRKAFIEEYKIQYSVTILSTFTELAGKVITESSFRNNSLKNMIKETFQFYLTLRQ